MDRNVQLLSFRELESAQTGSMLKTRLSTSLLRQSHGMSALPHANWPPLQPLRVLRRGYSTRAIPDRGVRKVKPAPRTAAATPVAARNGASSRVAKLGDRFIAFVLDTVVLFGVFAVVDAWIFMRWGTVEGVELNLTAASLLMTGALNALILFAYGWLLEASFGATLGKALVGSE